MSMKFHGHFCLNRLKFRAVPGASGRRPGGFRAASGRLPGGSGRFRSRAVPVPDGSACGRFWPRTPVRTVRFRPVPVPSFLERAIACERARDSASALEAEGRLIGGSGGAIAPPVIAGAFGGAAAPPSGARDSARRRVKIWDRRDSNRHQPAATGRLGVTLAIQFLI